MLTEDLARLKELDPATYDAYWNGMMRRGSSTADLVWTSVQKAWLQWCLQEAIVARKWTYHITGYPSTATIRTTRDIHMINYYIRADTSDSALLACYIAALEALA